ncbi:MAG: hypothetical protein WCG25_04130 [bacterium]
MNKYIFLTVISFLVNVQVLSVHMIFIHHRVSTDASCFMRAFFLANLRDASESAILTCAGNHCGTIAAEIHIANTKASWRLK